MSNRDNFPAATKNALALRAGYVCSLEGCGRSTVGPSEEAPDAVTMIGVAAHIHAAAPGGRRYDPGMSPENRRSIGNGIWLCQSCSVIVDRDEVTFTADVLRSMKLRHEGSRRVHPSPVSSSSTYDVISIGSKIICVGEFTGIGREGIRLRVKHFIIGDGLLLFSYASDFENVPASQRYVLVNALGDGRLIEAAPEVTRRENEYEVLVPISAAHPRINATAFGSSMAQHPTTGDLYLENGHLAMVSGVEAFAQHMRGILSLAVGDNVYHPTAGTRISEFHRDYAENPWLDRLVKMEVVRLASIPRRDRALNSNETPLRAVERVREVEVLSSSSIDQYLPIRFVLDVKGIGRWERELRVYIYTPEELQTAAEREVRPWLRGAVDPNE